MDIDKLGKAVRDAWIAWAKEQPDVAEHPSWLVPWDELPEAQKDVDRRIASAVLAATGWEPAIRELRRWRAEDDYTYEYASRCGQFMMQTYGRIPVACLPDPDQGVAEGPTGAIVHGFKDGKVDVGLKRMQTTRDVYWSPRWSSAGGGRGGANSYVLAAGDDGVIGLYSVNGIGEVRWKVDLADLQRSIETERTAWHREWWQHSDANDQLGAVRHFGLTPPSPFRKKDHAQECDPLACECATVGEGARELADAFACLDSGVSAPPPWLTREQAMEQAQCQLNMLLTRHDLPTVHLPRKGDDR